jgi:hypothetical protein
MAVVTAIVAGSGMDGVSIAAARWSATSGSIFDPVCFSAIFLPFRNEMKCSPTPGLAVS